MGKFDNIIIASDIDGTFLGKNSRIVAKNIEKIKYFTENGGKFTFSSGRAAFDVGYVVPMIDELANIPLVLCNGAYLYDYKNNAFENIFTVDNALTGELIRNVSKKFPMAIFRITAQNGFIVSDFDEAMKHLPPKWADFLTVRDINDLGNGLWHKTVFMGTPDVLRDVLAFCRETYASCFTYTQSSDHLMEICPFGVSKALQLKYLKYKLQKQNPNVKLFCIGDYDNDFDMLRFADIAVCPSNALDKIKEICNFEVCSNDDGAICDLIEKIEKNFI